MKFHLKVGNSGQFGHDQINSFYAENKTGCWLTIFSVMGYTVKDHGQPVSLRSL